MASFAKLLFNRRDHTFAAQRIAFTRGRKSKDLIERCELDLPLDCKMAEIQPVGVQRGVRLAR
jgi:hypothetical protein